MWRVAWKDRARYLLILLVICGAVLCPETCAQNNHVYNFSADWVSSRISTWEKVLAEFKGKPNVRYLEIGVYEGRSMIWMLENILTHPTSRATGIDIFTCPDLKKIFLSNLKISGYAYKVKTITGNSQIELKYLPPNSFDFIYIDGSHYAKNVLADIVLSWPLLKNNGLLILDDYGLGGGLPLERRPQIAIDAFVAAYRNEINIIHHDYQVIVRKREITSDRIPFGQYEYMWEDCEFDQSRRNLYRAGTEQIVELSGEEKNIIEKLLASRKAGDFGFYPDSEFSKNEDFVNLMKKLKLREGRSAD